MSTEKKRKSRGEPSLYVDEETAFRRFQETAKRSRKLADTVERDANAARQRLVEAATARCRNALRGRWVAGSFQYTAYGDDNLECYVADELCRRFGATCDIAKKIVTDVPDRDGPYGFVRRYEVLTFTPKQSVPACEHCRCNGTA